MLHALPYLAQQENFGIILLISKRKQSSQFRHRYKAFELLVQAEPIKHGADRVSSVEAI
jgi:hypothetical protein